jgi:hypothetical protein
MKRHQMLRFRYGALCPPSTIILNMARRVEGGKSVTIDIKQRAHELIEALPDNATWQELLYAFELRADVDAGLADSKAGRLTDVEELRRDYGLR